MCKTFLNHIVFSCFVIIQLAVAVGNGGTLSDFFKKVFVCVQINIFITTGPAPHFTIRYSLCITPWTCLWNCNDLTTKTNMNQLHYKSTSTECGSYRQCKGIHILLAAYVHCFTLLDGLPHFFFSPIKCLCQFAVQKKPHY